MTAPTVLPPKRVIEDWKAQGLSYAEIAARCERLGEATIKAKKKLARKVSKSKPGPKGLKHRLNRLKIENLSKAYTIEEVAKMHGVSASAIHYWRRKWKSEAERFALIDLTLAGAEEPGEGMEMTRSAYGVETKLQEKISV